MQHSIHEAAISRGVPFNGYVTAILCKCSVWGRIGLFLVGSRRGGRFAVLSRSILTSIRQNADLQGHSLRYEKTVFNDLGFCLSCFTDFGYSQHIFSSRFANDANQNVRHAITGYFGILESSAKTFSSLLFSMSSFQKQTI